VGTAATFGVRRQIWGTQYPNWGNSNYNAGESSDNARQSGVIVGYTPQTAGYKVNVREEAAGYGAKHQIRGTVAKLEVQ